MYTYLFNVYTFIIIIIIIIIICSNQFNFFICKFKIIWISKLILIWNVLLHI